MRPDQAPHLLQLTSGLPPEQVGGVEQHALELARSFRELGIRTGFYTRGERADAKDYDTYQGEWEGFPVDRVVYRWAVARSLGFLYNDERLGALFARHLSRHRPRLIHVHHLRGLGVSCLEIAKEAGLPVVMTLHDYWLMCPRGQMFHAELRPCAEALPELCTPCIAATWPTLVPSGGGLPLAGAPTRADAATVGVLHQWLHRTLELPDLLLTPSAAARERFLAFGVAPERIQVVENGLDPRPFQGLVRRPCERVRFGFVGALIPPKGAHLVLDAFARLPAGSASLLIAGNAPAYHQERGYLEDLERLTRQVPSENPVERLGTYAHEDLPELLARIDVLIVPPLWEEVFGLTLREGLLAGAAVIAAKAGGLPQAVVEGVNGFSFPPGDVAALAERMGRFVQDRGLAARLGAEKPRVRSVGDLARNLLDLYEQLGVRLP